MPPKYMLREVSVCRLRWDAEVGRDGFGEFDSPRSFCQRNFAAVGYLSNQLISPASYFGGALSSLFFKRERERHTHTLTQHTEREAP